MKEKANRLAVLTKGIIKENPNLVLLLGTCPVWVLQLQLYCFAPTL